MKIKNMVTTRNNAEQRGVIWKGEIMVISKIQPQPQTQPLTFSLLNILLANFATGVISLDELWSQIDSDEETECFRQDLIAPLDLPESIRNRISCFDADTGI